MKLKGYDGLRDFIITNLWYYTVFQVNRLFCKIFGCSGGLEIMSAGEKIYEYECSRCLKGGKKL